MLNSFDFLSSKWMRGTQSWTRLQKLMYFGYRNSIIFSLPFEPNPGRKVLSSLYHASNFVLHLLSWFDSLDFWFLNTTWTEWTSCCDHFLITFPSHHSLSITRQNSKSLIEIFYCNLPSLFLAFLTLFITTKSPHEVWHFSFFKKGIRVNTKLNAKRSKRGNPCTSKIRFTHSFYAHLPPESFPSSSSSSRVKGWCPTFSLLFSLEPLPYLLIWAKNDILLSLSMPSVIEILSFSRICFLSACESG